MPHRLRTLLQFRLGKLLVAISLIGVWLGVPVNRANRQKRSVAVIQAARGVVQYDCWTQQGSQPTAEFQRRPLAGLAVHNWSTHAGDCPYRGRHSPYVAQLPDSEGKPQQHLITHD